MFRECGDCFPTLIFEAVMIIDTRTNEVIAPAQNKTHELMKTSEGRERVFNKSYFNGGHEHGGYAHMGLSDFPCHNLTAQHVLDRKPESVLEVGCARGYVLKRIQDAGIRGQGIEISKHCYLTRVCDPVVRWDVCKTPWPFGNKEFDLVYSVAVMEHIPEQHLSAVIEEMARVGKRVLHGVDFGEHDDGFDKTHTSLHNRDWWFNRFAKFFPPNNIEIVDKETLEQGQYPESLFTGDGKLKVNVGSFTTMHHYGWKNVDIHDLQQFAQSYRYDFVRQDVRNGLPFGTQTVDLLHSSHFVEHLSYDEGLRFLRECRRVIRRDGAMRIIVPDAGLLTQLAVRGDGRRTALDTMTDFDEVNEGSSKCRTTIAKMWMLLHEGHSAAYDAETLSAALKDSGWTPVEAAFRMTKVPQCEQILQETLDMLPSVSLYMDAVPVVV